jgi:uncharacterized surface protein with fasciclin (FAS1) repeats
MRKTRTPLLRRSLEIIGGAAILVGSFWITLRVLDYYDPGAQAVKQCGPSLMAQAEPLNGRMPPRAQVDVGGIPMLVSRNIVENIVQSREHTMLYVALSTAGLREKLEAPGPFTFFAPTNSAFKALRSGQYESLLTGPERNELIRTLTYHVIPCKLTTAALTGLVRAGGGVVTLRTMEGHDLTVRQTSVSTLTIADAKGNVSRITVPDVFQSNGIVHVVDAVLMPN